MEKICNKCGESKSLDSFEKSSSCKDGYRGTCKECVKKRKNKTHKLTCQFCGEEFYNAKKKAKFCSSTCQGLSRKKRVLVKCSFCGKDVETIESKVKKHELLYCNQTCRTEHLKELMKGENNPNYTGVKKVYVRKLHDCTCEQCGKSFKSPLKSRRFCSHKCSSDSIRTIEDIPCKHCGKVFRPQKSTQVFCSIKCRQEASVDKTKTVTYKCEVCNKEVTTWVSQTKNKEHLFCSVECKNKGNTLFYKGKNSPLYNHDKPLEERLTERKYEEYYEWRKQVYERDNYTCQCCGESKGGNLTAHHLDGYNWCEEGRTDVNNGITLCEPCHTEFHMAHGYGDNTKEQYIDFINNR